jgi:spore coat polysaccharide biosynthesis protein SpsF
MAVEVFSAAVLRQADAEAVDPQEREHVTPFIYWRPERFRLGSIRLATDLTHHRWTVDTPADYELVKRLFEALYPRKPDFTLADVLAQAREHPDWEAVNQGISQHRPTRTVGEPQ